MSEDRRRISETSESFPDVPGGWPDHASVSEGELGSIDAVLWAGKHYGYGNMIGHLKRAWAEHLKDKFGFDEAAALKAADASAYPLRRPAKK